MKKNNIAALSIVMLAVGGTAQAADGLYFGGMLSRTTIDVDNGGSYDPIVFSALLGKQFSTNLAGEARFGVTASKGKDGNVKGEVSNHFGAFARGIVPLSPELSIYGLLGLSSTKVKLSGPGGSLSDSTSGLAFGLGGDYAINKTTTIGLEWLILPSGTYQGTDYDVQPLSLTFRQRF